MNWQKDDYVTDVGNGVCPVCGRNGCMLKVRFHSGLARSLERPIESIYTNCCSDCPGGLNTHVVGSGSRMSRAEARAFLGKIGNDLAREMAKRI
jgi:hypothetical protein